MAQTIKLKRSGTQNAVPSTSQLALGEVAINTYDGKMYIKKNDGSDSIVEIGGDATSSSGLDFTGNLNLADDVRIIIGDGNDLQIFHDGSHSYIKELGTGNLRIDANDFYVRNAAATQIKIGAEDGGAVKLYDAGVKKFETTSTGVTVTGTLAADQLKVGATERIYLDGGSNTFIVEDAADDLGIYVGGSRRLRVNTARTVATGDLQVEGGDIEFNQSSGQARIRNLFQDTYMRFQVNVGGTQTNAINIRGNNAYVGIGSAEGGGSPVYPLDVYAASANTVARFTSGGNKARLLLADNDTEVFVIAEDSKMSLGFASNLSGTNLTIDPDGRLLINTTSSIDNLSQLHIVGYTSGRAGITLQDGDSTTQKTFLTQSSGTTRFNTQNGTSYGSFVVGGWNGTTSADFFHVGSNGRVGIGTTSPQKTLHTLTSADIVAQFESSDAGARILIKDTTTSGYINASSSKVSIGQTDGLSANNLNIDASGNVGIGTTAPTKSLHLNFNNTNTARTTGNGFAGGVAGDGLLIQNSNTANNTYANLDFRAGTADARIVYQYTGTTNQGDFHFITDNTNSPATAMTIKNDGKVGIGDTTPSYKLDVNGTFRTTGNGYFDGSNINFTAAGANIKFNGGGGYISTTTAHALRLQTNNTEALRLTSGQDAVFAGTISSGNITAGNSSTSASIRAHYNDGSYMTLEGFGLEMNRGASYIRPTTDGDKTLYFGMTDDSRDWASVRFRSTAGLYLNGSQFIDTSRNLTNIGTISSGAITSSTGTVGASPNTFKIVTSTEANTAQGDVYAALEFHVTGAENSTGTLSDSAISAIKAIDYRSGTTSFDDAGLGFYTLESSDSAPVFRGGFANAGGLFLSVDGNVDRNTGAGDLYADSNIEAANNLTFNNQFKKGSNVIINNSSELFINTIRVTDGDFIVADGGNAPSEVNIIWRDHSADRLYLGTTTDVVEFRGNVNFQSGHTLSHDGNTILDAARNLTNIGTISSSMIQTTGGRVAIGNTSHTPNSTVDIKASSPAIRITDTAGGNRVTLENNAGTFRINKVGNELVQIFTNGNERFSVETGGAIRFNDAFTFPTTDGSTNQVLKTDGSGNVTWATEAAVSANTSISDTDGDTKIQVEESADEDSIRFDTAGTQRMRILANGFVAIGNGADTPTEKLHVFDNINNSASLTTTGTNTRGAIVKIENDNTTSGAWAGFDLRTNTGDARIAAVSTSTNDNDADLAFIVDDKSAGVGVERLRIKGETGNVGIGTASPQDLLHLSANSPVLRLTNTTDLGKSSVEFWDNQSGTSQAGEVFFDDAGNLFGLQGNANGIVFKASNTFPGSELMRLTGAGRLGIGTSAPSAALHAAGSNSSPQIIVENTSAVGGQNAKILFKPSSARSTGPFIMSTQRGTSADDGDIQIGDENGTIATFNFGRVGIGTTSPVSNLHVKTSVDNSVAQGLVIERSANSDRGYINYNGGGFQFRSTVGDPIVFGETDAEHMRILPDGNVGIGTSSPTRVLNVEGTPTTFGDTQSVLQIADDTAMAAGVGGGLVFTGKALTGQGDSNTIFAGIHGEKENGTSGNTSGAMVFSTRTHGSNPAERMRIDSAGNVCIGNTTAGAKLDIRQDSGFAVRIENSSGHYFRVAAGGAIDVGGSAFVDANRNLTNIGTVTASGIVNIGGGTSYYSEKLLVQGRTRVAGQLDIATGTGYGNYAKFTHDDTELEIATVRSAGTNGQIVLSPLGTAALTLDTSQNATFAGTISSGNITTSGYLAGPATFTIDPAAVGDNTGTVVIAGNLQVDGTTTTINSTTLTVDDKNITLASGSTNAAAANGAGLTVDCGSDTDATLTYLSATDQWKFNKELVVQDSSFPQLRLSDADDYMEIGYSGANFFFKRNDNDGAINFRRVDNFDVATINMSTKRVGIGTATPTYGLQVSNAQTSQSATGTMYVQASLNGSGKGLVIDSNTRTTNDNSVAALQTITRANTTGLKVQVDGKVGIGTDTPNYKLEISATGDGINLGGTGAFLRWNSGDMQIKNEGSYKMGFYTYNSSDAALNRRMVIDTNGNVGIGTASPTDKLDVAGALRLTSNISFDANKSGRIYKASNHGLAFHGVTGSENDFALFTPAGQLMVVNPTGTNNVSLIPTAAGNVGIGTTNPSSKLVVDSGSTNLVAQFKSTDNSAVLSIADNDTTVYVSAENARGSFGFYTGTNTSNLNITSNGNVGIGTNNLNAKLNVEELGIDTTTTSTSATTQVAIDTFAAATFRSARYTIQVTNSTDSTYHLTEILLIHNGTTPQITEYGTIFTGSAEATFDADISSGSVRLLATPATTDSMTFKVVRHCITV